jgi:hypothetical protein
VPYYRPRNKPFRRPMPPPPSTEGHLYYVRLNTPVGLVYKLGFTTMASVQERFAFKGDGAEKLIDRELLFVRQSDAWAIEQELHRLFDKKKLFPVGGWSAMPLYGNGQSELYVEDVLGLDHSYTPVQAQATRDNILVLTHASNEEEAKLIRATLANHERGFLDEVIDRVRNRKRPDPNNERPGLGLRLLLLVVFAGVKLFERLCETEKDKRDAARIAELCSGFRDHARIARLAKLRALQHSYEAKAATAKAASPEAPASLVHVGIESMQALPTGPITMGTVRPD